MFFVPFICKVSREACFCWEVHWLLWEKQIQACTGAHVGAWEGGGGGGRKHELVKSELRKGSNAMKFSSMNKAFSSHRADQQGRLRNVCEVSISFYWYKENNHSSDSTFHRLIYFYTFTEKEIPQFFIQKKNRKWNNFIFYYKVRNFFLFLCRTVEL